MCLYQKPHLFSPLVDCFNAKHCCRNTMCNEWTTRSFFHLTLSFNPAAIITCFTNLASLFHCVSKPIAQMFCRVISRNESWRISVPPAVQIGPVLGVKRKKILFPFAHEHSCEIRAMCGRRSQECVELQSGCAQFCSATQ